MHQSPSRTPNVFLPSLHTQMNHLTPVESRSATSPRVSVTGGHTHSQSPLSVSSTPSSHFSFHSGKESLSSMTPTILQSHTVPIAGSTVSLDLSGLQTEVSIDEERNVRAQKFRQFDLTASQILPFLFLGSSRVASSLPTLQQCGITHILNLCPSTFPNRFPSHFNYISIDLDDNPNANILYFFPFIIPIIDSIRLNRQTLLVHCHQGVSRSASVVIAYLMFLHGTDYDKTFRFVRSIRNIVQPNLGFHMQLLEWEQGLKNGFGKMQFELSFRLNSPVFAIPTPVSASMTPAEFDDSRCYLLWDRDKILTWFGEESSSELRAQTETFGKALMHYFCRHGPDSVRPEPDDRFINHHSTKAERQPINIDSMSSHVSGPGTPHLLEAHLQDFSSPIFPIPSVSPSHHHQGRMLLPSPVWKPVEPGPIIAIQQMPLTPVNPHSAEANTTSPASYRPPPSPMRYGKQINIEKPTLVYPHPIASTSHHSSFPAPILVPTDSSICADGKSTTASPLSHSDYSLGPFTPISQMSLTQHTSFLSSPQSHQFSSSMVLNSLNVEPLTPKATKPEAEGAKRHTRHLSLISQQDINDLIISQGPTDY
ncbi:putative Protein-tyrosine-phosphatase MKP1 [Blattamonas nauphoetae]|uniref:Protein-tyrosine-phosphatase n=1 Tax=Blattamonas nauphoetae TaxID=2049346 RepID=A0ABQ9WU87_9EUKA|nr:putative Protein-tyrosine-phosphatase MKP1 [Blattamonas nauphoetae]